jgi:CheY-like chemotaxis protein
MKKILVIEDDPIVGTVYRRFLESHGFAVEVATDGAKGLEQLPAYQPDAVILDLMLPKVGGIAVLMTLRAQEAYRDLPIVVLTNASVPAFIEQAMQAGANHVFDKAKDTPTAILGGLQRLLECSPGSRVAFTN